MEYKSDEVLRPVGRIFGALKLPHRKKTAEKETVKLPIPSTVKIPLKQNIGAECELLVKVGDRVLVGTKIGDSDNVNITLDVPVAASHVFVTVPDSSIIKEEIELYEELKEVDEKATLKIHKNDLVRVVRALEIYYSTGKKKSEQNDKPIPRFDFVCVSIDHPRERLYQRINQRVDIMKQQGLLDEVQGLLAQGLTLEHQSMQGIGYKEVLQGFEEGWSETEMIELIKKNTRNYAKRQITFFKRMQNHVVVPAEEATAENIIERFLKETI